MVNDEAGALHRGLDYIIPLFTVHTTLIGRRGVLFIITGDFSCGRNLRSQTSRQLSRMCTALVL